MLTHSPCALCRLFHNPLPSTGTSCPRVPSRFVYAVSSSPHQEPNPIAELVLTVVLPSLVLDYLSDPVRLGPFWALVVSLVFPLAFGGWCWWKKMGWNALSILGLVTVLLSGGLGLLKLDAFWFATKESAMPVMLGLAFPVSHRWGRPLINSLIMQAHLLNMQSLGKALLDGARRTAFDAALLKASWGMGFGMIGSAVANFFLALHLLGGKAPGSEAFVKGIGTLNWASVLVIGVPLMGVMMIVFHWLVREIQQITGLEKADLMNPGRTVRRQVRRPTGEP